MSSAELNQLVETRDLSLAAASLAAPILPAIHPLLRPAIGVGSRLLWLVRVLPAALLTSRYGQKAFASVLRVVAERLTAAIRPDDVVARIGGDEFLVLFQSITTRTTRCLQRVACWKQCERSRSVGPWSWNSPRRR